MEDRASTIDDIGFDLLGSIDTLDGFFAISPILP